MEWADFWKTHPHQFSKQGTHESGGVLTFAWLSFPEISLDHVRKIEILGKYLPLKIQAVTLGISHLTYLDENEIFDQKVHILVRFLAYLDT